MSLKNSGLIESLVSSNQKKNSLQWLRATGAAVTVCKNSAIHQKSKVL